MAASDARSLAEAKEETLITFYHLWVAAEWEAEFQRVSRRLFLETYRRWFLHAVHGE
jgi:hypothetical protein